jgi:hypothetical protein
MNFRTALAASAINVAAFFVVAVGVAIVLSKGFGVDDTVSDATGFGAFLLLQFFVRRHLKNQATAAISHSLPLTSSSPVASADTPPAYQPSSSAWFTVNGTAFYGDGNWLAYPADSSSGTITGPVIGRIYFDDRSGVYSIVDAQGRAFVATRIR